MASNARIFLHRTAAAFFAVICATAAFNVVINTYDAFPIPVINSVNSNKHGMDRHSRIAKAYSVKKKAPEWVILGTSRAESAFDPLDPYFRGFDTYNLAFPGGAMYEDFRYLQHATASGRLKKVIVALDYQQFLGDIQNVSSDFSEERLVLTVQGKPSFPPLKDLFWLGASGAAFGESWYSFKHRKEPSIYRTDGYRIDTGDITPMLNKQGGQRQEFLNVERGFARLFRGRVSAVANTSRIQNTPWTDLERILSWCNAHGIQVEFLVPAVHARLLALMSAMGLWDEFETWKRKLVVTIARFRPEDECSIWDFAYVNGISSEPIPAPELKQPMRYWRESSHATRAAGEAMLAAMSPIGRSKAFGHCLTPAVVDRMLAGQRNALETWARENPKDVAELRAIVERTD